MQLEEGLDTGRRVRHRARPDRRRRRPRTSCAAISSRVGTDQLVRCLARTAAVPRRRSRGEPVYAAKIKPEDLRIDWSAPGGAGRSAHPPRWRVDDVPRQAPEGARGGAATRRRPASRRARCRPAYRDRATGGQGSDGVRRLRSAVRARPPASASNERRRLVAFRCLQRIDHEGCLRQPRAVRRTRPQQARRPRSASSSPNSSTAPRACAAPAMRSSTVSCPSTRRRRCAPSCAWARISCTSPACRRTPPWARPSSWRRSGRAASSTRCCGASPTRRCSGRRRPSV